MAKNPHDGHRKRLRAEFLKNPINDATPPHKVLEFLLFYSIPRHDTNEIAHALMEKFHTFSNVFDASEEELLSVEGVGENTVALIKNILPIARIYEADKHSTGLLLRDYNTIGEFILRKYAGIADEHFSILCLDNSGKLLGFEMLNEGDISSVGVSTRTVLETAMRTRATSCVIAHNHPSGIALPSGEDIAITRNLKAILFQIGVRLVDHIIISGNDFVSLRLSADYKSIFE